MSNLTFVTEVETFDPALGMNLTFQNNHHWLVLVLSNAGFFIPGLSCKVFP